MIAFVWQIMAVFRCFDSVACGGHGGPVSVAMDPKAQRKRAAVANPSIVCSDLPSMKSG